MWKSIHKPVRVIIVIVLIVVGIIFTISIREFFAKTPWISFSVLVLLITYTPLVASRKIHYEEENIENRLKTNDFRKFLLSWGWHNQIESQFNSSLKVSRFILLMVAFFLIWSFLLGGYNPIPSYDSDGEYWNDSSAYQRIADKSFGYTWIFEGRKEFEFFSIWAEIGFYVLVYLPVLLMIISVSIIHKTYSAAKIRLYELCKEIFKDNETEETVFS